MNPIPDDEDMDELEKQLHDLLNAIGNVHEKDPWNDGWRYYDTNGNEIFPAESELERLDKKYAHIFDELENG